jgi:hypothetical protein
MAAKRRPVDRPVRYWLHGSGEDFARLLANEVSDAIKGQVVDLLAQGRAESAAEYAARMAEIRQALRPGTQR